MKEQAWSTTISLERAGEREGYDPENTSPEGAG